MCTDHDASASQLSETCLDHPVESQHTAPGRRTCSLRARRLRGVKGLSTPPCQPRRRHLPHRTRPRSMQEILTRMFHDMSCLTHPVSGPAASSTINLHRQRAPGSILCGALELDSLLSRPSSLPQLTVAARTTSRRCCWLTCPRREGRLSCTAVEPGYPKRRSRFPRPLCPRRLGASTSTYR